MILGSLSAFGPLSMDMYLPGLPALIAPLVGVAGTRDAVPMAVLIGACGLAALAINLVFSGPVARKARAGG